MAVTAWVSDSYAMKWLCHPTCVSPTTLKQFADRCESVAMVLPHSTGCHVTL